MTQTRDFFYLFFHEGGKWKDLSTDVLVNIFLIELGWSHLLDVPFVCKSCYKATLEPQCWEHLIFPSYIKPRDIWENSSFVLKRRAIRFQEVEE